MFWHVTRCNTSKLVHTLNEHLEMYAFMPKSERYFGKELINRKLYIRSFDKQFKVYFKLDDRLVNLLDNKYIYLLKQELLGKLFDSMIKKVNKYHRIATIVTEILSSKRLVAMNC